MSINFRARVIFLLTGLFALVLVPAFIASYYAIRQSAMVQARQRVETGARVMAQALDARGDQLHREVEVLTSDFGFKRAVATGDQATIRTALYNHGKRIGADLAVLSDLQGHVTASIDNDGQSRAISGWDALLQRARRHDGLSVATRLADQGYQLVIVPLRAPTRMAWVGMGFALNDSLARQLKALTRLDISFVAVYRHGSEGISSTLPRDERHALMQRSLKTVMGTTHPSMIALDGDDYFSLWKPLDVRSGHGLGLLLQYPLGQAMAAYRPLLRDLVIIGLLSLLAALVGALWLARSVTGPVLRLAAAARRVEQGDYLGSVTVRRNDELGNLATAFENMQHGIAERESQIAYQAWHDALTGLANRAGLDAKMGEAIADAERQRSMLAVLMLDLDRFKEINDTMGHATGDRVLLETGMRLKAGPKQTLTVARFGGDEFVVLLEGIRDAAQARALGEDLAEQLGQALLVDNLELYLDISIGIALYPEHGITSEQLLRRADIAMYEAKQSHSRVRVYESGRDAEHLYRLSLVHDLRRAIPNHELSVHYQPKLNIKGQRIEQVEALLRWRHPEFGLVPPDEFIPLAEHSGGIRALTNWVMHEVIRQCRAWQDQGIELGVAINLSAMDLGSGDLPDMLAQHLRAHGVAPGKLMLEVTETAVMRDAAYSLDVLNRLKACGVRLAIDDFGTGYSSLSHLKRLPVDELKIDKSFVINMARDEDDAVIVRSTIELAHNMSLHVAAEGVEDAAALSLLESYRCDSAQGYLISRPLPADEFTAWLDDYSSSTRRRQSGT